MICGRDNMFKAVRADRKGKVLSGSVGGRVFGERRQEVREGRVVLVEVGDGPRV